MSARAALQALRATLANSAGFQKFVGALGYPTKADAHIYDHAVPSETKRSSDRFTRAELQALRPYALIHHSEDNPVAVKTSSGTQACGWSESGLLIVHLLRDTPSDLDLQQAAVDLETIADEIVKDIQNASELAERLDCQRISRNGPFRVPEEEYQAVGDAQEYLLMIDWGRIDES